MKRVGQSVSLRRKPEAVLRVGELAKRTGKTVRALHLYEERGLLMPSERTASGYRLYSEDAVRRVEWIAQLQELGFSLSAIEELVGNWQAGESAPESMEQLRTLYEAKIAELDQQILRMRKLREGLANSLGYLDTCKGCAPSVGIDACPMCDRHGESQEAPLLIGGLTQTQHH